MHMEEEKINFGPGSSEPVEVRAVRSLGLGFDLTSDFRLRFAKGYTDQRCLVKLDEANTRDIVIPGSCNKVISGVSKDIGCDKGDLIRFRSDVLEFNQMSEFLNQKSSVQGKVPSGYFNALFSLSGAWLDDAKGTKNLAFDGCFISLYNLHLMASPLVLRDEVKKAVPSVWDPAALSRFIRTFGTHIIVEMAIGGQDIICVRQGPSSKIPSAELKSHLEDLGDLLFSYSRTGFPLETKLREGKNKSPEVFLNILQHNNMGLSSYSESSSREGLAVVRSKRGGNVIIFDHSKWLSTVQDDPDSIMFKFVPITSLLSGVPGSGYLSHAINLYLRYKPDPEDLEYFLEFQVPNKWAPVFNELALGPQRKRTSYPHLQFAFMGSLLYVNTDLVLTDRTPTTGLRLYLENRKSNRLAIHVQHLSSIPSIFRAPNSSFTSEWQGSENAGAEYYETIQCKRHSAICTAVVKHNPEWLQRVSNGVFIVTGAQLVTRGSWPSKVLHLRLLFTHIPNCAIRKTEWTRAQSISQKDSFQAILSTTVSTPLSNREASPTLTATPKNEHAYLNSGIYPGGPPVLVQSKKLLKYVDMAQVVRGPHHVPGHWLVTAAKLIKEGGKIGLHVKFALLQYPSEAEKTK